MSNKSTFDYLINMNINRCFLLNIILNLMHPITEITIRNRYNVSIVFLLTYLKHQLIVMCHEIVTNCINTRIKILFTNKLFLNTRNSECQNILVKLFNFTKIKLTNFNISNSIHCLVLLCIFGQFNTISLCKCFCNRHCRKCS